jgi:hypothetical protein
LQAYAKAFIRRKQSNTGYEPECSEPLKSISNFQKEDSAP